ncbi:SPOR domain-containing protein [Sphingomonas mollis]|uniref:SPOR domain-containing protein n=1 Tax=Sphingomonas mollis TaxID=2795726 RepID=A0ABS0XKU5_9SPHN|nr:SPOR domain-containing protein [Sphingomonas sp. BT553]MBJ6120644.1 SPOR domain-containing protein [Sphingomonas sp. BT553]
MKLPISSALAVILAMAAAAPPLLAQEVVQPLGLTDADLLATQMRQIAANPRDVDALAQAGELSIKLGDLSAAASLFARADKIDPRNARVKAGMGSILVRSERPGEALRFFDQAEKAGLSPSRFAADRGLAYDLIGQQDRAQRDYRIALANGSDDETVRRYALSLGISGRQAQALQQLDPLVRKQDRAGWRAQAFVLAMNGDTAAAAKIATTMMPAGMAQGLTAFFQRLPTLSPIDRAFAVHFGEIYPTPERLADAKLIPALPAFVPDTVAPPVQVAAVTPVVDRRRDTRSRDTRSTRPAATAAPVVTAQPATNVTQVAAAPVTVAPVVATPTPVPATPAIVMAAPRAVVQPVPQQPVSRPVEVAAATTVTPRTVDRVAPVQSSAATQRADSVLARIVASLSIPASELGVVEPPRAVTNVAAAPTSDAGRRVVAEASAKEARDTQVRRVVAAKLTGDAKADDVTPTRAGRRPVVAEVEPVPKTAAGRRAAARKAAAAAREEAALAAVADVEAEPKTAAGRRAAARKAAAAAREETVLETADAEPVPKTAAGRRAAARKAAAAAKEEAAAQTPAERRAAARVALAEKKKTAETKVLADKAAAEKKAARANPARVWVQVASGANEGDLAKAWTGAKAKAPAVLGTRGGYTLPFRATNRVLTGPFKTDAEARAFVNQLAKKGVAGFPVTTEAGQQVARLPGK